MSILKYWKIIELRNLGMDQYLCCKCELSTPGIIVDPSIAQFDAISQN